MARLLVIDDDARLIASLRRRLRSQSLELAIAMTGRQGLDLARQLHPDAIILNARLPDMSGMVVFDRIHEIDARLPVIIITANDAATDTAIEATKRGAFEYLLKPLDLQHLLEVVQRAVDLSLFRHEPAVLENEKAIDDADPIVGRSPAMQAVYKAIGRVAPREVPVLIAGESGTGKELIARAIFHHSRRADSPFLTINCAAIPELLLESALFGHERGAFTGATRRQIGKFEQAHGGTLFLDEIGDMSVAAQAKVLRLLQEQRFERVGGSDTIQTDVRLIAATNKDLEAEVAAGRFRDDLLFRLNVFTIRVPPLRERRDDIPLLIAHFLPRFTRSLRRSIRSIGTDAQQCLVAYDWPGNVRQLQSVLKYAIVQAAGDVLTMECIPEKLRAGPAARPAAPAMCMAGLAELTESLLRAGEPDIYRRLSLEMDRVVLEAVLRHVKGNQVKASELLGMSRTTLRAKLRALNLGDERQS